MGWFDIHEQSELINSFTIDTLTFEQAIGEKISIIVYILSMFVVAMAQAFYYGWIYSLVIVAYLPLFVFFWTRTFMTRQQTFTAQR